MNTNILEPVVTVPVGRYNELIRAETAMDAMCMALYDLEEVESYNIKDRIKSLLKMFGRLEEK